MELRLIESFLTIVQEGTILAAAQKLNIAQPSLSVQMKKLEEELGVQLFQRGKRRITLTEAGLAFRKRGQEILNLVSIAEEETASIAHNISTIIRVGAAKSQALDYLAIAMKRVRDVFPKTRYEIISDDSRELLLSLHHDLLDIALVFTSSFDPNENDSITSPALDVLGLYMRKDDPLAKYESIPDEKLKGMPLIISRLNVPQHFGIDPQIIQEMIPVVSFNLMYNTDSMIRQGIGYGLSVENLIDTSSDSVLTFRPLEPLRKTSGHFVWKREGKKSQPLIMLIDELRKLIQQADQTS